MYFLVVFKGQVLGPILLLRGVRWEPYGKSGIRVTGQHWQEMLRATSEECVETEGEAMSRAQGLITGTDTEGSSEAVPEGLTNDSSKL